MRPRLRPLCCIAARTGAALVVAMIAGCATAPEKKLANVEPLSCPPVTKPVCPPPTPVPPPAPEVRGMGVVGEQPVLKPGDTFEYSSGSSIPTAVGTMRGSYQLVAEDGTRFEANIPEFTLSVPRVLH